MPKKDALSLGYQDWVAEMEALGEKRFRADQICGWLYKKRVFEWQLMSDIGLEMRSRLDELFRVEVPRLEKVVSSRRDGTKKFLWDFGGSSVESVAIAHPGRLTACLSTQVGCPLGCPFCATGQSGFERNMTVGEMVGQFLAMEARLGDIKNLVFMGMGEPMLNYDNVIGAVRNLNHPKMRGLGIRHITISTSGVVPGILRLAREGLGVRLAVSLHAPNDDLRDLLVPINAQYPLKELREALETYQEATGDRITIEYSLFDKVNDSVPMARQLGEYLKGLSVFINLIPGSCTGDARYVTSPPLQGERLCGDPVLHGVPGGGPDEQGGRCGRGMWPAQANA
ncbi:23S rRNA m2A2503 methyltransferase [Thermanaerovibrio velox DSM 12556]|uniref:23S rRNA m2A2503 methyltransferase n=1 Tax=Thermanaerovibrio velox DSM 12556 TaxID=926567 RepID=H0UPJ1_9BACT|nr:23S rRNA (adenine(2503)-C(2))-methyltransferase RlmN [Thermanaerovibrio velox]EHM09538.1 23S rRNA m2A2503 methyltransferase [Thermanaerovibrio velox DSM 12556]